MATSPRTDWSWLLPRRVLFVAEIRRPIGVCLGCRADRHIYGADDASPASAYSAARSRSGKLHHPAAPAGATAGACRSRRIRGGPQGLSWKQILTFDYPGTRLSSMPAGTKIEVWITADNDSSLRVLPATALRS